MKRQAFNIFTVLAVLAALVPSTVWAGDSSRSSGEMISAIEAAVAAKAGLVKKAEVDDGAIEVEILASGSRKFEVDVEVGTNRILKVEDSGRTSNGEALPAAQVAKAIKAAVAKYPGTVAEAEVERRRGVVLVEVELYDASGNEIKVAVDPATGQASRKP